MSNYVFFKYRNIDKFLIESLVNRELFFACPERLNDPFDCRVDIKKTAENAVNKLPGWQREYLSKLTGLKGYFEQIQKDTGNAGICSFSLELENTLLWSHYANEHKGICLAFDFPESFFLDDDNNITGVSPVEYGANPLTDWFINNAPTSHEFDFKKFTLEVIKRVLTIKNWSWAYEKEVRIIRKHEGIIEIPTDILKQVCFGLNTSTRDIQFIRNIFNNCGYEVSYCKIERSDDDFGLRTMEI